MEQQQQLSKGTLESMRLAEETRNNKIQLLKTRLVDSPPTSIMVKENKTSKRKKVTFEDEKQPKRTKKTPPETPPTPPPTPAQQSTQFQLTPVQEIDPQTESPMEEDYDSDDEILEPVPDEKMRGIVNQPEFKTTIDNMTHSINPTKPLYPKEARIGPIPKSIYRPRSRVDPRTTKNSGQPPGQYVTAPGENHTSRWVGGPLSTKNKVTPIGGLAIPVSTVEYGPRRTQTTMANTTTQNSWRATREAKRQRTLEEPSPDPVDQDPSFFSKAIDTIKPHATNLGSRVASQFALLVLGGALVFAKGHLQRMASNHDQHVGRQTAPPPYIQNPTPSQPVPPKTHNYSAPPNHQDASLSERMFGPTWR